MDTGTIRVANGTSGIGTWFRIASIATAISILVLVIFVAGGIYIEGNRGLNEGDPNLIEVHGILANLTLLGGIVLTVLGIIGYRRRVLDRIDLAVGILFLILTVVQISLGYEIEGSGTAGSLHWPNGVLLTILTTMLVGRSLPRRA